MPVRIFRRETNACEEWLDVNDDGTVTHHDENSGWPMMKAGIGGRDRQYSVEEAKDKWPSYAQDFDMALVKIRGEQRR